MKFLAVPRVKSVIVALALLTAAFALVLVVNQGRIISAGQREDAAVINMTAYQWAYTPSTIVVRQGQTVIIHIRNLDIPHGFALEEYGVNVFLPPGEEVTVRFVANRAGSFMFFCNVFCGTGHPTHRGILIVEG